VIGRNAQANLREYQKRSDHKRRIIAANDTTGDHLSRLEDGEYFVMTEQQRRAAKKARLKNQDAVRRITEYRKAKGAYGSEGRALSGVHEIPETAPQGDSR